MMMMMMMVMMMMMMMTTMMMMMTRRTAGTFVWHPSPSVLIRLTVITMSILFKISSTLFHSFTRRDRGS